MANGRHSFVAFYPSDWMAGTALMRSRIMRSIYFDVCLYNWDTARACPPFELEIMLGDVKDWARQIDQLIAMGKLHRNDDGSIENPKAMAEAAKALRLHAAKSAGGKGSKNAKSDDNSDGKTVDESVVISASIEPEPEPELSNDNISDDKSSSPALKPEHVVDAWNEMALRWGLPVVKKLNPARKRSLAVRIREHPIEDWMAALNAIERAPWMHGDNDRGWRADFDFLLQPSSFQKLIEGSYDRKQ